MKFMILVKSSPDIEARLAATSASEMKEQMAEMEKFNDKLRGRGLGEALPEPDVGSV